MKKTISIFSILIILIPSIAGAYSRQSQGYSTGTATELRPDEEIEQDEGVRPEKRRPERERGPGMGSAHIWGYVLLTAGGMAAIAGSTIVVTTDQKILGAALSAGGAAMALTGTLLITLGSHSGYSMGPAVDPASGTYGVVLAKRF